MPEESILQFLNYTVQELSFQNIPVSPDKTEFELRPNIEKKIEEASGGRYNVTLTFSLSPSEENELPFALYVSLVGHFKLNMKDEPTNAFKESILNKHAVAILFPFLRGIISQLTSCANIQPLIIPILNFYDEP